jgi:hypothetical protein
VGHDKWHQGFYSKLKRNDGQGSCCNLMDCRPTQSRMVGDHYEVKVDGVWTPVPYDKINNVVAPDGGAHVCAPKQVVGTRAHGRSVTASLRPSRNARIRIFASRTKPQETGLPAWACEPRTQKCRQKLSVLKGRTNFPDPAELWPQRLFAFELRRGGNAAGGLMPGSQQRCLRGGWSIAEGQELPRFSADPEMIRRRPNQQHHCSLCAGLFPPRERVWWSRPASLTACSSPPASALRPPRGLGGGGAILRRRD